MNSLRIKKGDNIVVIAGKDKGKKSKVLAVSAKANAVIVEGVNMVSKHQKPRSAQDKGGIVKREAKINASNVMIVCSSCNKATRIAMKEENGKKIRVCKKCGKSLSVVETAEKPAPKKTTKTPAAKKPAAKKTPAAKKPAAKKTTTAKKAEPKKAPAKTASK